MSGNIYFIACNEPRSLKIGFTSGHPQKRLKQLQTGCPVQLVLIGWYPGERSDEAYLHEQLQDYRLSGEWFRLCEGINNALIEPFRAMHINNILCGHEA